MNQQILDLLIEKFPSRYNYKDIIAIQTPQGVSVKAVEVRTEDTVYLVKISAQLEKTMEDNSEDYSEDYSDDYSDDLDEDFSFEEQDSIESE